jgi:acetyl esterase
MNLKSTDSSAGPFEHRIRARGAVLDMPLTQELYKPLLERQRRDGVVVHRDLIYGLAARHTLDLYQPQGSAAAPVPCLLFFHGGGFVRGDKSERENVGQYFARQGYAVAVVNYRLAPENVWPCGAEDVIAAYRWLIDGLQRWNIDRRRIYLAGESAGAAHVAAAALIKRFHPAEGLAVAGAILISGVYNAQLEWLAREEFGVATPDPRNEPYFGSDFSRYAAMSTVELIDAKSMPLLITYAELDPAQMQVQAGELFARLMTVHGFKPRLRIIRGHNHLTQGYAVNTGDESLTAPILAFLHETST